VIDRRKYRSGLERRENRHRRLDTIVHEHDNAVASPYPLCCKCRREPVGGEVEVLESRPELAGDERGLAGASPRALPQKLFNAHGSPLPSVL